LHSVQTALPQFSHVFGDLQQHRQHAVESKMFSLPPGGGLHNLGAMTGPRIT
jgi:hypothetical protein